MSDRRRRPHRDLLHRDDYGEEIGDFGPNTQDSSPRLSMPHSDPNSPDPPTEEGEGLDLDEWVRSYRHAGGEGDARAGRESRRGQQPPAEISPFVLLYTGFFLGPPATLIVALWLMVRRFDLRAALVVFGLCGAIWCSVQAASFGFGARFEVIELRIFRTSANFLCGLIVLWFLRARGAISFAHDRQTWLNSAVVALLIVAAFTFLPPDWLVWLGR